MKKITLIALGLASFIKPGFSQTMLQGGVQNIWEPVQRPYMYYDLMRTEHPAWVREYRPNENVGWTRSNLLINRMENKRFTELDYNVRNLEDNAWINFSNWKYQYTEENNRITSQLVVGRLRYENGFIANTHNRNTFQYTNDKLSHITIERFDSSAMGYFASGEHFFSYDASGNMILDSIIFPQYQYKIAYTYNGVNQCTAAHYIMNNDTTSIEEYEYINEDLTRLTGYDVQNGIRSKFLEYEFTYTAKGFIENVSLSMLNDADEFVPFTLYKHSYNNNDQMQWMSSYNWANNRWETSDSVAIIFDANGKADTSYGYTGGSWDTWKTWPEFRFLFDESLATGLTDKTGLYLEFTAYPNPANEKIYIMPGNTTTSTYLIELSDLLGNTITRNQSQHNTELNTSDLQPGIYLLRVSNGDRTGTQKVMIQR